MSMTQIESTLTWSNREFILITQTGNTLAWSEQGLNIPKQHEHDHRLPKAAKKISCEF